MKIMMSIKSQPCSVRPGPSSDLSLGGYEELNDPPAQLVTDQFLQVEVTTISSLVSKSKP
jgi:hypothetical protein